MTVSLINALVHIHNSENFYGILVMHRDVKGRNIFRTCSNSFEPLYKLGDFGSAVTHQPGNKVRSDQVGTLGYYSPVSQC